MNYQQIKDIYKSKGFKFFDNGRFNLNILYVRTSQIFTDKYSDKLYIAYRDSQLRECVYECPCSTKAGKYYVLNPIVHLGIKGTAVLVDGYQYKYQFIDNNSWLNTPYLKQIENVKVWRDGVIDNDIDEQNIQVGIFGINCHVAGALSQTIYNWSAGCLVTPKEYWLTVLELIRKSCSLYGDKVTIGLIRDY